MQWTLKEEGCGQAEERSKGILVEDVEVWRDKDETGLWMLGKSVELVGESGGSE